MMEAINAWLHAVMADIGYGHILVLMALESSLFPIPSEVVMIPAGYLARKGQLDPFLVILTAGVGCLLGASFNYVLGRYAGRLFLLRFGRYLLIDERKYHQAEALFLRSAYVATFFGRFLPVIRHLISLPAGVFGMSKVPFAVLTFAGSTIWCAVLTGAGYFFGAAALHVVEDYTHQLALAVSLLLVALAIWFLIYRAR
jgi:membrane protein DedA with SNARE-associated domain